MYSQGLLAAEEALDLTEDTGCFLADVTGQAQLAGDTLDDFRQLGGIQVDAQQVLDDGKRILRELCDQIVVAGQLTDKVSDDFLNIHGLSSFLISRTTMRLFLLCCIIDIGNMKGKKSNAKMRNICRKG